MKQCLDFNTKYTLPVGSIRMEQLKYRSLWSRIRRWFKVQDRIHKRRLENEIVQQRIEEDARGDLVETMKGLER